MVICRVKAMTPIKVTCGIIINSEGKVFVCRRKPEKSQGGYWEFPGGKVEEGESLEDCLRRELAEELQMEVQVNQHFKTVLHDYGAVKVELISYLCDFKKSTFDMIDHDRYEWLAVSQLLSKKLAPADVPIAKSLSTYVYLAGE